MTTRQLIRNKSQAPMYNMGGYKSRYNIGGLRRRQTGGMYADNTVQSTGQGASGPLTTANIVYNESDPKIQAERLKALQSEEARLRQASIDAGSTAEATIEQGELQGEQDALLAEQRSAQTASQIKSGLQSTTQAAAAAGLINPGEGSTLVGALKGAKTAYNVAKTGTTAANIVSGMKTGTDVAKIASTGIKSGQAIQGLNLVKSGATTGLTAAGNAGLLANASTGASTAASVGAGIGKFATSGAGLGLIGAGLGYGINKLWGDDDPTTTNFAEGTSGVLSGAGTGASIGSMIFPGPGTAIGAGIGALVGLGQKLWGSRKAKRAKKKAEREHKRKVRRIVTKHNKDLMKNFASQRSRVRAGEVEQKTYSGYDMGRNVVAQMGGMRMGTSRYGYAA